MSVPGQAAFRSEGMDRRCSTRGVDVFTGENAETVVPANQGGTDTRGVITKRCVGITSGIFTRDAPYEKKKIALGTTVSML